MLRFPLGLLLAFSLTASARAETVVRVRVLDPRTGDYFSPYSPMNHPHYYRRYRVVRVLPRAGEIVAPYRVAPAAPAPYTEAAPRHVAAPASRDYGDRLARLNDKLYRHRHLLENQAKKGVITVQGRDHYLDLIAAIEHDEHEASYDNNGFLTNADFEELNRRADEAGQDIETFLAAD